MIGSIKQSIVRLLKKSGHQLFASGYLKGHFFEFLLYECLKKNDALSFIQIGANDGTSFDPLHGFVRANHQRVTGIVIEPLNDYYEQLCDTYRKFPGIKPLKLAIHNTEKEMPIYRINPDRLRDYPGWGIGISSFRKEKLIQADKVSPEDIINEPVACVSLQKLVRDHRIDSLDLLQIDTEGYDYEIVSNIDFDQLKPTIIQFEHGIPKGIMSKQQFAELRDILHHNGYELWVTDWDAIAYRTGFLADI